MRPRRILFICSANTDRSPTFHNWFARHTDYEIKSCGVHGSSYDSIISEELLAWADNVYVMDISHVMFIDKNFPAYLDKVEVIGCSDQYRFEDPELIEIVKYWAEKKEFEILEDHDSEFELPKDMIYTENIGNIDDNSWSYRSQFGDPDECARSIDNEAFENLQKAVIYLGKLFDNHVMTEDSKIIEQTVKDMLQIE